MATLAESFLADLDDLSDVSDQEEGAAQDTGEDEEVSIAYLLQLHCLNKRFFASTPCQLQPDGQASLQRLVVHRTHAVIVEQLLGLQSCCTATPQLSYISSCFLPQGLPPCCILQHPADVPGSCQLYRG